MLSLPPSWFVFQSDLEELLTDWSEDKSVGNIILKYVSTGELLALAYLALIYRTLHKNVATCW